ncbi:alpha/beta fold hydrolase [Paractinoplanes durhamensis]|uniref:Uncharacterized protein n=1 Tax=Paractinoplanes durhamensis TaxID=113563 RepID=A0ABQ3YN43_9ACTN|nr:alpha/beta hydrolase [Actinoplanes durhamensis]GID98995.1 hypothetical protein Adu01nite_03460 [Actinoplanes durhamensis]
MGFVTTADGAVVQLVLVSAVPPFMLRTPDNPGGLPDLDAVDVPALVIHGDDDQVVPFAVGGQASAGRLKNARPAVCPGAPHGITDTHKDQLSADLLAFLKEYDV